MDPLHIAANLAIFPMITGSAKSEIADRLFRIEPTLLDEVPGDVNDVVAELAAASSHLGASLHPTTGASLADRRNSSLRAGGYSRQLIRK